MLAVLPDLSPTIVVPKAPLEAWRLQSAIFVAGIQQTVQVLPILFLFQKTLQRGLPVTLRSHQKAVGSIEIGLSRGCLG